MSKYLTLLLLLIFSNSINAELFVKKKVKFSSCEQLIQTGNYKGEKNYTLYNENNDPYEEYCETPYYSSCKEIYDKLQSFIKSE